MQQILDKLDVLECFEEKNRRLRIGEFLEKQANIYMRLSEWHYQPRHVNPRIQVLRFVIAGYTKGEIKEELYINILSILYSC